MKRQTYNKEKIAGLEVTQVSNKTIVLPFKQATYSELLEDKQAYNAFIEKQIAAHPELFPSNFAKGWSFYGTTKSSVKQGIKVRRIQTKADNEVWQIRPSFVMPYMTFDTQAADNIIFLMKWAPDWALARVFKKDVMTIYRLRTSPGRYNLVGTTVKDLSKIPNDVGADEKHSHISGEKVYVATTVGEHCFLGVSVSSGAGEEELTRAYEQFQREARQVRPEYQPNTE